MFNKKKMCFIFVYELRQGKRRNLLDLKRHVIYIIFFGDGGGGRRVEGIFGG